jgi:hypothetical protein
LPLLQSFLARGCGAFTRFKIKPSDVDFGRPDAELLSQPSVSRLAPHLAVSPDRSGTVAFDRHYFVKRSAAPMLLIEITSPLIVPVTLTRTLAKLANSGRIRPNLLGGTLIEKRRQRLAQ